MSSVGLATVSVSLHPLRPWLLHRSLRLSPNWPPKESYLPGTSSRGLSLLSRVQPWCRRFWVSPLATSSLAVSSPSTSSQHRAATFSQGYQSWVTVPSRRFTRPQGLHPPGTCRPYFVPVPSLGFLLGGSLPPVEPSALSGRASFLWFVPLQPLPPLRPSDPPRTSSLLPFAFYWQLFSGSLHSKAFISTRVRFADETY